MNENAVTPMIILISNFLEMTFIPMAASDVNALPMKISHAVSISGPILPIPAATPSPTKNTATSRIFSQKDSNLSAVADVSQGCLTQCSSPLTNATRISGITYNIIFCM